MASWTGLGIISTSVAFLISSQTAAVSVMIVLSFGGTPLMMALPIFRYLPTNAGVLNFIDRANQTSDWLYPPGITVSVAAMTLAVWGVAAIIAALSFCCAAISVPAKRRSIDPSATTTPTSPHGESPRRSAGPCPLIRALP